MSSTNKKGNYYKARTKKWLESLGYEVAHMERALMVPKGDGKLFPIKKDQLGSDLMGSSPERIVFVQVKLGPRSKANDAAREFAKHAFPPSALLWIALWERGFHEPVIVDAREKMKELGITAPSEKPRKMV